LSIISENSPQQKEGNGCQSFLLLISHFPLENFIPKSLQGKSACWGRCLQLATVFLCYKAFEQNVLIDTSN